MRLSLPRVLVVILLVGCEGETEPTGVIERETFIATWIDLRNAAISAGGILSESARDRVLEQHDLTEEQLLGFADAYGGDPRYMAEVWTEVENRMRPAPPPYSAAQP